MLPIILCLIVSSFGAPNSKDDCVVGETCTQMSDVSESYFWPTAHGHWKHYSNSPYDGPSNLSTSVAWAWHHPDGPFNDMPLGAVIDDQKNIYVTSDRGVFKLNSDGVLLWSFLPPPLAPGNLVPNSASLYNGLLYFDTVDARMFALDMETGQIQWQRQVAPRLCCDTGVVTVYSGYIVIHSDPADGWCNACTKVRGLNASDGTELWQYSPDNPVWDLMVQFVGDGTFVFQDLTGRGYRNNLIDGSNIWKNGGVPGTWTDGTQALGPNGVVYTTKSKACQGPGCVGSVTAHSLLDGKVLWDVETPGAPNTVPAVGRLGPGQPLSVVAPMGPLDSCGSLADAVAAHVFFWRALPEIVRFGVIGMLHLFFQWVGDRQYSMLGIPEKPYEIQALDAQTGKLRWRWAAKPWGRHMARGDEAGFLQRVQLGIRSASCPALPAPRIGSDGTVYVGHKSGLFFAIRDANGDGMIDSETEVSSFDCESDFSSIGSAHAPGMIVMASGSKVWTFKT